MLRWTMKPRGGRRHGSQLITARLQQAWRPEPFGNLSEASSLCSNMPCTQAWAKAEWMRYENSAYWGSLIFLIKDNHLYSLHTEVGPLAFTRLFSCPLYAW